MAPRLFACFRRGHSHHHAQDINPTSAAATADQTTEEQRHGGAILVELFSSQGCATSPQAELLMSRLGRGDFGLDVPVIVLAFHVDYWDYMGWKDPYGSSLWTVRQKSYVEGLRLDTMFTPQVVIQGRAQCVGTDEDALLSNIRSATRFPAPTLQIYVTLSDVKWYIMAQGPLPHACSHGQQPQKRGRLLGVFLALGTLIRSFEELGWVMEASPKVRGRRWFVTWLFGSVLDSQDLSTVRKSWSTAWPLGLRYELWLKGSLRPDSGVYGLFTYRRDINYTVRVRQ